MGSWLKEWLPIVLMALSTIGTVAAVYAQQKFSRASREEQSLKDLKERAFGGLSLDARLTACERESARLASYLEKMLEGHSKRIEELHSNASDFGDEIQKRVARQEQHYADVSHRIDALEQRIKTFDSLLSSLMETLDRRDGQRDAARLHLNTERRREKSEKG